VASVIELSDVAAGFTGAPRPVLDGLALTLERGEFAAVVGASGAGKSTLLRIVAGLAAPLHGSVRRHLSAARDRRSVAMVFQEARLMPWRSVYDNVALGLEGLEIAAEEVHRRIAGALALVGLGDFAERWPRQLSGGQRQRVGIARALAVAPEILLMDEPFSAVDAITRQALQDELLRIWGATGTTILFVTHDIEEAAYLADRVLLLGGAPARISESYDVPAPRPRQRGDAVLSGIISRVKADLSDLLLDGGGI
jgi:NitT/TauT family transport system ATP-binding protein